MYEQLKNILIEEFSIDAEAITPEAELKKDLGINSLDLADLVFKCEDTFGVTIDEKQNSKFITVGDVVKFLETLEKE